MIASDSAFRHPFFKLLSSLKRYIVDDYTVLHSNGSVEFLPTARREPLSDGRMRLFQSEEKGLEYKKYAFFRIHLSAQVNNSYFDFLEPIFKSITNEQL